MHYLTHWYNDATSTDLGEGEAPPVLVGDGVTDDTDAYQWYLDHDRAVPFGTYRLDLTRLRLPLGTGLFRGMRCEPSSGSDSTGLTPPHTVRSLPERERPHSSAEGTST